MYRRSLRVLAQQSRRTIVRDPRRRRNKPSPLVVPKEEDELQPTPPMAKTPLPFGPQPQHSTASSLASYAVAGVGVTLGVVLVRVVLGF